MDVQNENNLTSLFANLGEVNPPRLTLSKLPLTDYLLLKISAEIRHRPLASHLGLLIEEQVRRYKDEWINEINVHASIKGIPPEQFCREMLER